MKKERPLLQSPLILILRTRATRTTKTTRWERGEVRSRKCSLRIMHHRPYIPGSILMEEATRRRQREGIWRLEHWRDRAWKCTWNRWRHRLHHHHNNQSLTMIIIIRKEQQKAWRKSRSSCWRNRTRVKRRRFWWTCYRRRKRTRVTSWCWNGWSKTRWNIRWGRRERWARWLKCTRR